MKEKSESRAKKNPDRPTGKKPPKQLSNVFCTGLTADDVPSDAEAASNEKAVPVRCYLCKRQEGARTFSMKHSDTDEPMLMDAPIQLVPIVRTMMTLRMHFKVCVECAALLGVTGDAEADLPFT